MEEDVVHSLQIEALLYFRKWRVEEMSQGHEVQQQAHDDVGANSGGLIVDFFLNGTG